MRNTGSAADPLWYKDAIIYELHVRAFFDGNNDGIGDFAGLMQKLDYLQDLGVTCLWLLPFFPSPLRDDGYDIADYLSVHPIYGTMEDFQAFLNAAHECGMQVMIELVVNHTSDQHPWFQAARQAPPGSPEREFYVWSDTDQKYRDARIIFTDTEKSNWTWDPVAKAYFWHRFFSHQPDLNFDNPAVLAEIVSVMRYWLDLGVDALRLDAIPYLVERDGTNCENLPETHQLIKALRRAMDDGYANRLILAEANQWPTDVRPYFGDGDECHMAFHFPLMPRIFMGLRLEDRLPITDIMAQTPEIPPNCQWGLFLRNHDELTLEMVSDEERDYMYLAYSADPRMRINVGIRRRLAPLMDNNSRRMELLNSLLFSFPGTPIIYYGDELAMGDNIYLGDRNGVRTPMQWSADRNGGFSRANPAKLFSPVIMDPIYGYEAINVEAQHSDSSSMLNWMRNMIALRKLFRVFGRGSLEFLSPANTKVLAYLRKDGDERILCVANLSRFAQPLELDLSSFQGMRPVEMLGCVEFPPIVDRPYSLTLAPYGFLWFELHGTPQPIEIPQGEPSEEAEPVLNVAAGWDSLLEGVARHELEQILPGYLQKQHWFRGRAQTIADVSIVDWAALEESGAVVALLDVKYETGLKETYFVPLAMRFGSEAEELRKATPNAVLQRISSGEQQGVLHDGLLDDHACTALLGIVSGKRQLRTRRGLIRGIPRAAFPETLGSEEAPLAVVRGSSENNNSSIFYGDRFVLKIFRRQEAGPNPDCEIGRYLTEKAHFERIPPFGGSIEYTREAAESSTLAMLQGFVPNQGDGWQWTLDELQRFFEQTAPIPFPAEAALAMDQSVMDLSEAPPSELAREYFGLYLDSAVGLGRRTAEMHLALTGPGDDPAFGVEVMTAADLGQLANELEAHAAHVFDGLKQSLSKLHDDAVEQAGLVLSRRRQLLGKFRDLETRGISAGRTRIHGDYHLGQVLRVKSDYIIIDFEGEPARSLAERRAKQSPLKDVAGMLRSFSYAAWAGLQNYTARRPDDFVKLAPWANLWERATAAEFLRAYRESAGNAPFLPPERQAFEAVLDAYVLDKVLYELLYELNNRPAWVGIPLRSILTMHP